MNNLRRPELSKRAGDGITRLNIVEELAEMGFTDPTEEQITHLLQGLQNMPDDESTDEEEDEYDQDSSTLFDGIDIDTNAPFNISIHNNTTDNHRTSSSSGLGLSNTPIRIRQRGRRHQQPRFDITASPALSDLSYPYSLFDEDEDEKNVRKLFPEGYKEVEQGRQKIVGNAKIIEECAQTIGEFQKLFHPLAKDKELRYELDKENIREQPQAQPAEVISLSPEDDTDTQEPTRDRPFNDLRRLRRVRFPEPGRAAYKHDPVATYEAYKEEWKKHLPQVQKELRLRWHIRSLMLKHKTNYPTKHPDFFPEKAQHPKDWSPRAYLD